MGIKEVKRKMQMCLHARRESRQDGKRTYSVGVRRVRNAVSRCVYFEHVLIDRNSSTCISNSMIRPYRIRAVTARCTALRRALVSSCTRPRDFQCSALRGDQLLNCYARAEICAGEHQRFLPHKRAELNKTNEGCLHTRTYPLGD